MNMNAKRFLCAFSAVALVFACGCESEKEDDFEISVSPLSCKLKVHESRAFTASGGEHYRWTLKDPSLGTLSSMTGSTVVYTASSLTGDQVITVTGDSIYGEERPEANAIVQQVDPSGGNSDTTSATSSDTNTDSTQDYD